MIRYNDDMREDWNVCIRNSCNGTFLFDRNYMDYHKDRFEDASLMFYHKNKLKGVMPANIQDGEIHSHNGLTYGGLIWDKRTSSLDVGLMLSMAYKYYSKEMGADALYYKPLPYIYHTYPASQDLYFITAKGAELIHRKLSTTIDISHAIPFTTLRRRCVAKALKAQLSVSTAEDEAHWQSFWKILTEVLQKRHRQTPVHTVKEILYLKSLFPHQIRLLTIEKNMQVVAGTVLFITENVVHAQYISSDDVGYKTGALDYLLSSILNSDICQGRQYFDFGVSTEDEGAKLNEGLLFQKEGFGGRGICYDEYLIKI